MNIIEENTNTIVEIDLTNPKNSVNDAVLNALFKNDYEIFSQLAIEKDGKPVMLLFLKRNTDKKPKDYSFKLKFIIAIGIAQTLLMGALLWT
jgi:hypothetical protein|tara:strand:- start:9949 stop:10224 length:276 start_codon:yes stop_codon:yes gene_type:complete